MFTHNLATLALSDPECPKIDGGWRTQSETYSTPRFLQGNPRKRDREEEKKGKKGMQKKVKEVTYFKAANDTVDETTGKARIVATFCTNYSKKFTLGRSNPTLSKSVKLSTSWLIELN